MGICRVIINPSSGKANIMQAVPFLKESFEGKYEAVEFSFTEKGGDALLFAKQACEAGYEAIICAGGDGTVREVVNGLMQGGAETTLGILPTGTVNDVARSLSIPLELTAAVRFLLEAKPQKMDVGKVNQEYFISLIAIGGIPEAIHRVSIAAKTKWGILSYLGNGAWYALRQKSFFLTALLNGEKRRIRTSLVVVSLQNSVAGMKKFFEGATPFDGRMRIMLYPPFKFFGAAKYVSKIILGTIGRDKNITVVPFETAELQVEEELPITIDGDQAGQFPLHIQIIPQAISVYASK